MSNNNKNVLAELLFDRAWFKQYKHREQELTSNNSLLNPNGIPLNCYLVFKIICIMKKEDLSMQKIADKYLEIYGVAISQATLSRSVFFLSDEKNERTNRNTQAVMGFITLKRDAFNHKKKSIFLTEKARNLQKILCK